MNENIPNSTETELEGQETFSVVTEDAPETPVGVTTASAVIDGELYVGAENIPEVNITQEGLQETAEDALDEAKMLKSILDGTTSKQDIVPFELGGDEDVEPDPDVYLLDSDLEGLRTHVDLFKTLAYTDLRNTMKDLEKQVDDLRGTKMMINSLKRLGETTGAMAGMAEEMEKANGGSYDGTELAKELANVEDALTAGSYMDDEMKAFIENYDETFRSTVVLLRLAQSMYKTYNDDAISTSFLSQSMSDTIGKRIDMVEASETRNDLELKRMKNMQAGYTDRTKCDMLMNKLAYAHNVKAIMKEFENQDAAQSIKYIQSVLGSTFNDESMIKFRTALKQIFQVADGAAEVENDDVYEIQSLFITYWLAKVHDKETSSGKNIEVKALVMNVYDICAGANFYDVAGGSELVTVTISTLRVLLNWVATTDVPKKHLQTEYDFIYNAIKETYDQMREKLLTENESAYDMSVGTSLDARYPDMDTDAFIANFMGLVDKVCEEEEFKEAYADELPTDDGTIVTSNDIVVSDDHTIEMPEPIEVATTTDDIVTDEADSMVETAEFREFFRELPSVEDGIEGETYCIRSHALNINYGTGVTLASVDALYVFASGEYIPMGFIDDTGEIIPVLVDDDGVWNIVNDTEIATGIDVTTTDMIDTIVETVAAPEFSDLEVKGVFSGEYPSTDDVETGELYLVTGLLVEDETSSSAEPNYRNVLVCYNGTGFDELCEVDLDEGVDVLVGDQPTVFDVTDVEVTGTYPTDGDNTLPATAAFDQEVLEGLHAKICDNINAHAVDADTVNVTTVEIEVESTPVTTVPLPTPPSGKKFAN